MAARTRAGRGAAAAPAGLAVRPLTPARWDDLALLFGQNGACGGCWCMYWRLTRPEFARGKGEGNRAGFRALVESGAKPGLIAYRGREPVGWVAVEPRERYPRLARARTLKPIDDLPAWSITCLFVRRDWRRRGVSVALLQAAAEHAFRLGAAAVEGYPVVPKGELPAPFAYTGIASAFEAAGFDEAARPSPSRRIMRRKRPQPPKTSRKR